MVTLTRRYEAPPEDGDITDRTVALNEGNWRLTYDLTESPFPVTSYEGLRDGRSMH